MKHSTLACVQDLIPQCKICQAAQGLLPSVVSGACRLSDVCVDWQIYMQIVKCTCRLLDVPADC